MASAEANPTAPPPESRPLGLEDVTPWIDSAVQKAIEFQKTVEDTIDAATAASRSRLSQIHSTSSAHLQQTIDSLEDVKSIYNQYEDLLFARLKDGIYVAASHPLITGGAAVGVGSLALKRPRRFLYYNTLRLFVSEESLLSKADTEVKELHRTISQWRAVSDKLERRASVAEEDLIRGRTKLRQTGKQIQEVIRSAYKIERQAVGLKYIIRELPGSSASRFRSQVSSLASEAKQERNALNKEVRKISNYGISV